MSRKTTVICALITVVIFFLLIVVGILGALLVKALILTKQNFEVVEFREVFKQNETAEIVKRLTEAIKIPTINLDVEFDGMDIDSEPPSTFVKFMEKTYPTLFNSSFIKAHYVNESLLLRIKGTNETLKPYLFNAHFDVVPADSDKWSPFKPYEGGIDKEGYLYGRGTLDDKSSLMATLEVVSRMKTPPKNGFFVACGHDEEGFGIGALSMAAYIRDKLNETLEFVIDEGFMVLNGTVIGVDVPVATVGIAEKGFLTVKITATAESGHSMAPKKKNAINLLAAAIKAFSYDCHPQSMTYLQQEIFEILSPYAHFPYNIFMANMWMFSGLASSVMNDDLFDARLRTTTAATMIRGGTKTNVLPSKAEVWINHRILPGGNVNETFAFDQKLIESLTDVSLSNYESFDPVPESPRDEHIIGYRVLERTIHSAFPNAVLIPDIETGATDSRAYFDAGLTKNIYRFLPINIHRKDLNYHGDNERIHTEQYRKMCNFYAEIIRHVDQEATKPKK